MMETEVAVARKLLYEALQKLDDALTAKDVHAAFDPIYKSTLEIAAVMLDQASDLLRKSIASE